MVIEPRMGNNIIGLAALHAELGFVAGYPDALFTVILKTVAAYNPDRLIRAEWSTSEKIALEVAAGASPAGMRCMVAFRQMGVYVLSDTLMSLMPRPTVCSTWCRLK